MSSDGTAQPGRDVIVVGASAGGVEALRRLVADLPADLPAAVLIVLHIPENRPSVLPRILERAGHLPVEHARDGEPLVHGKIYVAPPNHHLLVRDEHLHVTVGPRENGVRPAADVLFRTAARSYGPRVIGVVLSGALRDGSLGLRAVKRHGGLAIVQTPEEALFSDMPLNAMESTDVDYVIGLADMPALLVKLVRAPLDQGGIRAMVSGDGPGLDPVADPGQTDKQKAFGRASGLTCPECHVSLWEIDDNGKVRVECRVGHSYSLEAFMADQGERVEAALWTAINLLKERSQAFRRMADISPTSPFADRYQQRADETEQRGAMLEDLLAHLLHSEAVG